MMKKTAILMSVLLLVCLSFAGCGRKDGAKTSSVERIKRPGYEDVDKVVNLPQLDQPKAGEEIVALTVQDYGTIKIRLFPSEAPKAVENFKSLVKSGYYNGKSFYRVMKDFVVQGGDPNHDGTGKESIYGAGYEVEHSEHLYHFRGAVGMMHGEDENTNGGQFYIVQCKSVSEAEIFTTEDNVNHMMTNQIRNQYLKDGGYPYLDGFYTVFGQVYEGMGIVDSIAGMAVKPVMEDGVVKEYSAPVEEIIIERAVVTTN